MKEYSVLKQVKTNAKNLRKTLTLTERIVWSWIRNRQLLNLKFRRQFPIGPYILDFYCSEKRVGMEIDGDSHDLDEQIDKDAQREIFLKQNGILLLRITNKEVLKHPEETEEFLKHFLKDPPHSRALRDSGSLPKER